MANLGSIILFFIILAAAIVSIYLVFIPNKNIVEMTYKCDDKSECTGVDGCPVHGNKKDCDSAKDCEWKSNISKMEKSKKEEDFKIKPTDKKERFSNRCSI